MKQLNLICLTLTMLLSFQSVPAHAQANFWSGGGIRVGPSPAACAASLEGAVRYSSSNATLELCDGTNWGPLSNMGASVATPPAGSGYFVLTESTWDGNLGGQAGASSKCLTELTTKTNWRGYADASSRSLLNATKVRAFICTSQAGGGCINPRPSTTYVFATVGDPLAGGAMFTTDASSNGPGDSSNWSAVNYYGVNAKYWLGRARNVSIDPRDWDLVAGNGGGGCAGFTNNINTDGAAANSNFTGAGRFFSTSGNRTVCSTPLRLICLVDP
jgi:hypothetical protein